MANEITQPGQILTYGGASLTLFNSVLASKITSLLVREGNGSARAWKLFDSSKADFLNTKKILNHGDIVLVNAKSLPMDFDVLAPSTSGPISTAPYSEAGNGPITEFDGQFLDTDPRTPSFAFSSGVGTLQMQVNGSGSWVAPALVASGNTMQFRILHNAPFTGVLTLS